MDDRIVVLVVEDEPLQRLDIADQLADAGFEVLEARDADQAIALLQEDTRIRLIFTDVDMPGTMDGLMLAKAVARRWPPVRIIVTSGHRTVEITDIPDGSVFFSKPYAGREIVSSCFEMLKTN